MYESFLLWQSSTAKALNFPLTQELVPPEQVPLLTCITCSGISKIFHSLKLSVWYISTLKKNNNNREQWNSCNLNSNFKSFSTHHVFQHNRQHYRKLTGHISHYRSNSLRQSRNQKSHLKSRKDADLSQHKINTTNLCSS